MKNKTNYYPKFIPWENTPYKPNMKNKTKELKLYRKIENLVNPFIKKWCGDNYTHLVDYDDNDGQELRENIAKLVTKHTEQIKKEAYLEGVKKLKWRIECSTLISELYGWKSVVDMAEEEVLDFYLKQYLEKGQNE